jgi:hypothetical protein
MFACLQACEKYYRADISGFVPFSLLKVNHAHPCFVAGAHHGTNPSCDDSLGQPIFDSFYGREFTAIGGLGNSQLVTLQQQGSKSGYSPRLGQWPS